jgi:predicted DNA binding CopG/RHH family protein
MLRLYNRVIPVRFTEEQWKRIMKRAEEKGLPASSWIRMKLTELMRMDSWMRDKK